VVPIKSSENHHERPQNHKKPENIIRKPPRQKPVAQHIQTINISSQTTTTTTLSEISKLSLIAKFHISKKFKVTWIRPTDNYY